MLSAWNPYVADIPAGSRRRYRYAATAAELNSRSVRRLFAVAEEWAEISCTRSQDYPWLTV